MLIIVAKVGSKLLDFFIKVLHIKLLYYSPMFMSVICICKSYVYVIRKLIRCREGGSYYTLLYNKSIVVDLHTDLVTV